MRKAKPLRPERTYTLLGKASSYPPNELLKRWCFFKAHAGYSTPPGIQACALKLAKAEITATGNGWYWQWLPDNGEPYEDALGDHQYWCDLARCGVKHRHQVEGCVLRDQEGEVMGSLWGIIDSDADYRRVVQAELALEALTCKP